MGGPVPGSPAAEPELGVAERDHGVMAPVADGLAPGRARARSRAVVGAAVRSAASSSVASTLGA